MKIIGVLYMYERGCEVLRERERYRSWWITNTKSIVMNGSITVEQVIRKWYVIYVESDMDVGMMGLSRALVM